MDREEIIKFLKKFKEKNKDKYHIERIGIFGSVAKNRSRDNSDIDVVVKLKKQDLFELIGIKQDLEEIFHHTVDIVSYRDKMNLFLKKRIDEDEVYV
ncbi:nucleotidyltransferase domain-containing protein [bacterium]|nr:nucleotidyltransferase domain-containing protein [bacterium]